MSETNDGFTLSHLLGAYFKAFPTYEWSDPETAIDLMLAEITTLRTELAAMTDRATKAEAGLSLAVRALEAERKCCEFCKGTGSRLIRTGECTASVQESCDVCGWIDAVLSESSIVAEAERLKVLKKDRERLEAAEQQLPAGFEWHVQRLDPGGWQIGVLRRGYSDAITYPTYREAIDVAKAQAGTDTSPNGLASDTFASGTDWRRDA